MQDRDKRIRRITRGCQPQTSIAHLVADWYTEAICRRAARDPDQDVLELVHEVMDMVDDEMKEES